MRAWVFVVLVGCSEHHEPLQIDCTDGCVHGQAILRDRAAAKLADQLNHARLDAAHDLWDVFCKHESLDTVLALHAKTYQYVMCRIVTADDRSLFLDQHDRWMACESPDECYLAMFHAKTD